jgi:hypothetical protein
LSRLPNEILLMIVDHLSWDDYTRFRRVNSRMGTLLPFKKDILKRFPTIHHLLTIGGCDLFFRYYHLYTLYKYEFILLARAMTTRKTPIWSTRNFLIKHPEMLKAFTMIFNQRTWQYQLNGTLWDTSKPIYNMVATHIWLTELLFEFETQENQLQMLHVICTDPDIKSFEDSRRRLIRYMTTVLPVESIKKTHPLTYIYMMNILS